MKIGFIGLGIMGMPMASNIAKKYELIGYDVLKKETEFKFASSYEEVSNFADVIITMVPKNEHAISLYNELLKYTRKDMIYIDMSTIYPEVSISISKKVSEKGAKMLDCPVVKSQAAAIKGELGIYVGGDYQTYEIIKPVLLCMGKNIIYMGDNGKGLVMKVLHNMLVGEIQNGVNEVLTMAKTLNMDLSDVVTAISYGGGQNFYLDGKAVNIKNNEYPTAFSVDNMNKDVHFARQMMEEMNLDLPGVKNVCQVYENAVSQNLGKDDFSATFKVVSKEK